MSKTSSKGMATGLHWATVSAGVDQPTLAPLPERDLEDRALNEAQWRREVLAAVRGQNSVMCAILNDLQAGQQEMLHRQSEFLEHLRSPALHERNSPEEVPEVAPGPAQAPECTEPVGQPAQVLDESADQALDIAMQTSSESAVDANGSRAEECLKAKAVVAAKFRRENVRANKAAAYDKLRDYVQETIQAFELSPKWRKRVSPTESGCLFVINNSATFRYSVALAIVGNAVFIALQTQYAMDTLSDTMPFGYNLAEFSFCFFFTFELVLRLLQERIDFFLSAMWKWNLFDTGLVFLALWQLVMDFIATDSDTGGANVTFLRVLRVLKMARVIRVVRALHFFDHLRIYLEGIFGCLTALMWLFVLLFVILFIFSIAFMQGTISFLKENKDADDEVRTNLHAWFRNVPMGIRTLFMSMSGGDDWGQLEAHLGEISLMYRLLFDAFLFFTLFGVLNIVTGLFCDSAAATSRAQRQLRPEEERAERLAAEEEIKQVFHAANLNGTGQISENEFDEITKDETCMNYFQALGVDSRDMKRFFEALDIDCSGYIELEEFVWGCMRLKDGAGSASMAMLILENRRFMFEFRRFTNFVESRMNHGKRS